MLPAIVRQLVLATASVTEIDMGAREAVQQHGWDGLVTSTTRDDPHVPLGASGWELGTGRDPRKKAQAERHSGTRNRAPPGAWIPQCRQEFVAVTARIWGGER